MHFSINSPHCPIPDDRKENAIIFFGKALTNLTLTTPSVCIAAT